MQVSESLAAMSMQRQTAASPAMAADSAPNNDVDMQTESSAESILSPNASQVLFQMFDCYPTALGLFRDAELLHNLLIDMKTPCPSAFHYT